MGARLFKVLPVLFWTFGASALGAPAPTLQIDQTILEAHAQLIEAGWSPAPTQTPSTRERRWAGVTLKSLSSCSGSGVGFCRFDYQRESQRLSVVTVPSRPGTASIGRVERYWPSED